MRKQLSQAALAVQLGVTSQTIYKIEKDQMKLSTELILKLKQAKIPIEDLLDENAMKSKGMADLDVVEPKFRKGEWLTEECKDDIKRETLHKLLQLIQLEDLTGRKIKFKNPIEKLQGLKNKVQVESAAKEVRKKWQIFDNPIQNVISLLEMKGVRVLEVTTHEDFNGMAAWYFDLPVIVLNFQATEVTRKRFSALHELGHLILQLDESLSEDTIENLCDVFASAMLMPKELIIWEVGSKSKLSNEDLKRLKAKYGISFQAILVSAVFARLISWSDYNKRMDDPSESRGSFSVQEQADRINQLLKIAIEEELLDEKRVASFHENYKAA
jgi:Zn-dependent peptidase ImmA (M78 family)/DNA-binding XRE family transcriptional regulator